MNMLELINIFIFFVTIYFFLRIIKQYMAIKSSENFIDTNSNFYLKVLSKQDKYKKTVNCNYTCF